MRSSAQRELLARRRAELDGLVKEALEEGPMAVSERLQRVRAYDDVLEALPRHRTRQVLIAAVVGVLAVSIAGLAWTIRVPSVGVVLELDSDEVEFVLADDLVWEQGLPLDGGATTIEHVSRLELPPIDNRDAPAWPDVLESEPWFEVEGEHVRFGRLHASSNARVSIASGGDGEVDLHVHEGRIEGELVLQGEVRAFAEETNPRREFGELVTEIEIPETVGFSGRVEGARGSRIGFRSHSPLIIRNAEIKRLSFMRQQARTIGEPSFETSVIGGSLILPEIGREIALRSGERVSLPGADGRLVELRVLKQVSLLFEGTVERILVGPERFQRDLTPRLLEHVYQNEPLLLFWSALLFLWGIIWNIRGFFSR